MSEGLEARIVAVHLLSSVVHQKQSFDVLLEKDAAFLALAPRDRSFTHMLVATTLRKMGQCDDLIVKLQDNPQPHLPPLIQNIMRIALTQIMFMHVADHAAVNTAVLLTSHYDLSRMKNFVNALLRRFLREKDALLSQQDPVQLNIPSWLLKPLIKDWGFKGAAEIGESLLQEAPIDVTIKNSGMLSHWLTALDAQHLLYNTIRLKAPASITSLSGYEDGHWWVQDAAAALPVVMMGDVKGKLVYDLCAAPGGKTAQLAAGGAQVIALDRSAKRLERLHENMERLSFTDQVEAITTDASYWQPAEQADMVLLDAPCSATGIIRRHPDVLHLKNERDIASLAKTQARILSHAAGLVKTGGIIIYCTCSIMKSEGEEQIERFLEIHPDFERVPLKSKDVAGHDNFLNAAGDVRLFPSYLPDSGGIDGFFISRLRKR